MSNYPNRLDLLVHGADAADRIHPVTKMVLENGSGSLPANDQARRIHIPEIARMRGVEAARDVLRQLEGFIAAGGDVKIAKPSTTPGMHNHLG